MASDTDRIEELLETLVLQNERIVENLEESNTLLTHVRDTLDWTEESSYGGQVVGALNWVNETSFAKQVLDALEEIQKSLFALEIR